MNRQSALDLLSAEFDLLTLLQKSLTQKMIFQHSCCYHLDFGCYVLGRRYRAQKRFAIYAQGAPKNIFEAGYEDVYRVKNKKYISMTMGYLM